MPEIVPKSLQTCFEHVLGQTFRKIFAQFSMECRVFENFQKIYLQISKNAQKCSQKYPNVFWGDFFEKILCPVFHGGWSFRKFSNFFFKIPKMPKIVPESIQTCFERVLGQIFRKIFLPSVPWNVESSKIFKKIFFKIPKMPKSFPKCIQTCFRVIFSKKILCPVFHGRSSFRKFSIFFSKFQKCPKSFPKVSKRVLNVFWGKFFEKFFCPVFRGGSSFRKFLKKSFQNSKNAQKCSQKYPNVF